MAWHRHTIPIVKRHDLQLVRTRRTQSGTTYLLQSTSGQASAQRLVSNNTRLGPAGFSCRLWRRQGGFTKLLEIRVAYRGYPSPCSGGRGYGWEVLIPMGGVAQCSLLSGRKGEPFLPLWNVECGMWQWKWQCPFVSSELIKTPKSLPG